MTSENAVRSMAALWATTPTTPPAPMIRSLAVDVGEPAVVVVDPGRVPGRDEVEALAAAHLREGGVEPVVVERRPRAGGADPERHVFGRGRRREQVGQRRDLVEQRPGA